MSGVVLILWMYTDIVDGVALFWFNHPLPLTVYPFRLRILQNMYIPTHYIADNGEGHFPPFARGFR